MQVLWHFISFCEMILSSDKADVAFSAVCYVLSYVVASKRTLTKGKVQAKNAGLSSNVDFDLFS